MRLFKVKISFNLALFAIFVVLFVIIGLVNPVFFSMDYFIGVMLRNICEIGMIALPVTLIIVTGGTDLSVGSILILSAMSGGLVAKSLGTAAGVLVCMLVGLVCGLFNGILITKLKVNPLVTTLATMYLFMGIARSISKGDSIYSFPAAKALGYTSVGRVPLQLLFYIVLAIIFYLVLERSSFGKRLFAIGLNEGATRFSGINTDRVKLIIYTLSGLICAFASLIWLGRFTSVKYDAGTTLNLNAITIVVLGGTSILGGVGSIKGTILATLIIGTLNSGLTVMNIPIDVQVIVNGAVLVISLLCYAVISKRMKRKILIEGGLEDTVLSAR